MNISPQVLRHAATASVAAIAGWFLHSPEVEVHSNVAAVAAAPRPAVTLQAAAGQAPLIAVASDGTVTLRVEQQPLEWVLEQIAHQSGWSDVRARATPVAASGPAPMAASETTELACADAPLVTPADAQRTLQAIERGSESDRFDGLLRSGDAGVVVPEDTLKTIVDTDASERVRMLAFERLIEARSGEPEALRAALEAGLYVPSAAIQSEARRRLDELRESERIDAASEQRATP